MTTKERDRPAANRGGLRHDQDVDTSECDGVAADLRRRWEASWRLPPLDCGCRDPWPCRCTDPPLSEHTLDGQPSRRAGELRPVPVVVLSAYIRRAAPRLAAR